MGRREAEDGDCTIHNKIPTLQPHAPTRPLPHLGPPLCARWLSTTTRRPSWRPTCTASAARRARGRRAWR